MRLAGWVVSGHSVGFGARHPFQELVCGFPAGRVAVGLDPCCMHAACWVLQLESGFVKGLLETASFVFILAEIDVSAWTRSLAVLPRIQENRQTKLPFESSRTLVSLQW